MATFAELQTQVQRRVIDLPSAVQQEVPSLINKAIRSLQNGHNFKVMEKTVSFTTVAGQRLLGSVPADWKEINGFPFSVPDLGRVRQMTLAANDQGPNTAWDKDDEGYPLVLWIGDTTDDDGTYKFEVWPLPDGLSDYTDGEYRITIPYYRFLPALSDGGNTNWFTANGEEFIVAQATSDAFSLDWDEQRMAVWAQLAAGKKAEVVKLDKLQRLAGVGTLVPHYQGVLTPQLRL